MKHQLLMAVFAETDKPLEEVTPLYIQKRRLRSGKHVLAVRTAERPETAAQEPFHKMMERSAGNNSMKIAAPPIAGRRHAFAVTSKRYWERKKQTSKA